VNFGMVEEDLYRSGQPKQPNFPFMEKLELKKIIYLAPDEPSNPFLSFVEDQGIELVHLGLEATKTPWKPMSEDVVVAAFDAILDPNSYPLHIMCHLGRHRTGAVIGCLRKLQRWNLASILSEYRRYAGTKVRIMNEQFIELFDTDLVSIPEIPPKCILTRSVSNSGNSSNSTSFHKTNASTPIAVSTSATSTILSSSILSSSILPSPILPSTFPTTTSTIILPTAIPTSISLSSTALTSTLGSGVGSSSGNSVSKIVS